MKTIIISAAIAALVLLMVVVQQAYAKPEMSTFTAIGIAKDKENKME